MFVGGIGVAGIGVAAIVGPLFYGVVVVNAVVSETSYGEPGGDGHRDRKLW